MLIESLMMEEKQLDFNRPLISIRRPITTQTSEPENKTRSFDSVTNKIPPSPPVYKSDIKSGPVRNPGTVPFQWEHKPGKPKDENKPDFQSIVEPHFVPKLPPGRTRADQLTKDKYHVEETKSYNSRFDDDDDSDDTYLDANDTLSRSESSFYNCSNVSGLDGSGIQVEPPFGSLSSDRQTQDLMMGRFLPAAKALTSETSPHLAKKPPKPEEPLRQTMKKEKKQNKVEKNPYRFNYSTDQEEEDGDTSSMMAASGICGLVPQLCMKSSFGLLNTVPSVRMQAHRAVSVRRMRSKYQDSSTPSNEEKRKLKLNDSVAQGPSHDGSLAVSSTPQEKEKLENFCVASRPKTSKNFGELLAIDDNTCELSSEAPVAEKTLYVDTVHSVDKKVQEESKKQSLKEHPSLDIVPYEEAVISQPKSIEEMNDNRDEDDFTEFSSQKVEESLDQAIVALPESNVVEMITKENEMNLEVESQRITANLESSRLHHRSAYHIVPPPPLPKAPSDSWLKRTLATIPSKNNSFTWLQSLGTDDNHFTKTHQANPKWETMVKTSNTQQGFVCFTKETLNSIPEA